MKATEVLRRCRSAERDKRRIAQQIQQRREAMESVSPRTDAAGGGHGTASNDKMASMIARIDELEQLLKQRQREHRAEIIAACSLLDKLPEVESSVLHKYYLMGDKLDHIAEEMGYTAGYVRNLKSDGERLLGSISAESVAACLPDWY